MVLRAWTQLSSLPGVVSDLVETIPTVMLLARLQEGPNADWEATDKELLRIFEGNYTVLPPFNHSVLLRIVAQESWGDDGDLLRVCLLSVYECCQLM